MKRLLVVTLAALFVFNAAPASASSKSELNVTGTIMQVIDFGDYSLVEGEQSNTLQGAKQRARVAFDFIASENLHAVLRLEMNSTWGDPDTGGAMGTDGIQVAVKHAYTQFTWPGSNVQITAGLQPVAFPAAVAGSPILDDDAGGILMNTSFNENIGLTLGWVRLQNEEYDATLGYLSDDADLFYLSVPMAFDGWNITPYAAYLMGDEYNVTAYSPYISLPADPDAIDGLWAGIALEIDAWDPWFINFDAIYGTTEGSAALDTSGFFTALSVDYKFDAVTVGLIGWYGSGTDIDDDKGGAMPVLTTSADSSGFLPTSMGFGNSMWTLNDNLIAGGNIGRGYDMWSVGLRARDFSFVDKLTHDAIVVFGGATSDYGANLSRLGGDGTYLEVNLDSEYAIYENLSIVSQLGYIMYDDGIEAVKGVELESDAWKAAFGLKYDF